jgi:hypothetical protein
MRKYQSFAQAVVEEELSMNRDTVPGKPIHPGMQDPASFGELLRH